MINVFTSPYFNIEDNEIINDLLLKNISQSTIKKDLIIILPNNYLLEYFKRYLSDKFGIISTDFIYTFDTLKDKIYDYIISNSNSKLDNMLDSSGQLLIIKQAYNKYCELNPNSFLSSIKDNSQVLLDLSNLLYEIKTSLYLYSSESNSYLDVLKSHFQKNKIHIELFDIFALYDEIKSELEYIDNNDYNNLIINEAKNYIESLSEMKSINFLSYNCFNQYELQFIKSINNDKIIINILLNYSTNKPVINYNDYFLEFFKKLSAEIHNNNQDISKSFNKSIINAIYSEDNPVKADINSLNDNVTFYEAWNRKDEIVAVAKYLKSLLLDESKNINPENILVAVRDIDGYSVILKTIFESYGLPYYLNNTHSLINSPIVKAIKNIFTLKEDFTNLSSFLDFLESNYFSVSIKNRFFKQPDIITGKYLSKVLLKHLNKDRIRDKSFIEHIKFIRKRIRNKFRTVSKDVVISDNYLKYLKDQRQEIITLQYSIIKIKKAFDRIPEQGKISDYIQFYLDVFNEWQIVNNIFRVTSDEKAFQDDTIAFEQVKNIFDSILYYSDDKLNEKSISINEFHNLVNEIISTVNYRINFDNINKIQILSPSVILGRKYEYVFIVGLNEGTFPKKHGYNYFINDVDRNTFSRNLSTAFDTFNQSVLKTAKDSYFDEDRYFYNTLSSCSSKLFLSFCKIDNNEKELQRSFLIDELLSCISNASDFNEIYNDYKFSEIKDTLSIDELILDTISTIYHQDASNAIKYKLCIIKNIDSKKYSSLEKSFQLYQSYNQLINPIEFKYKGDIKNSVIIEYLKKSFNKISISELEHFAKCPYSFFLLYILRLSYVEKDVVEVDPLDIGSIAHDILHYFFDEIKDNYVFTEDTYKLLDQIVDRVFNEREEQGEIPFLKIFRYEINKIKNLIIILIKKFFETEKVYKPKYLEWSFKNTNIVTKDSRFLINTAGRIDRVDIESSPDNPDEIKCKIIDYKLSRIDDEDDIIDNIINGLSFQLPIYIKAIEEETSYRPIGASLISIKKAEIGTLSYDNFEKLYDCILFYIEDYLSKMKSGKYYLLPKNCEPNYCRFSKVCRNNQDIILNEESFHQNYWNSYNKENIK